MGVLEGFRPAFQLSDGIMLTRKRNRSIREQTLDDLYRLHQTAHPHTWRIKRDAGAPIVSCKPTGTEPKLKAPLRQQVYRGRFACHHRWMAKVVGEDITPDAQRRGIRHRHEGGDGDAH